MQEVLELYGERKSSLSLRALKLLKVAHSSTVAKPGLKVDKHELVYMSRGKKHELNFKKMGQMRNNWPKVF